MKRKFHFAADAALGKLARHLRAAGFDTRSAPQSAQSDFWQTLDPKRIILTRTTNLRRRFKDRHPVFIRENDPWRQFLQVMRELKIKADDLDPFSRCVVCNCRLRETDRQMVKGRVPDYVWQRHARFRTCDQCRRLYWAGSHPVRMEERMAAIFSTQPRKRNDECETT
ncbi:Mut7-C RNAse domain-containing protein [uncultured Desulfosarcina sp.]|uniref:Mut7-C RNAse domain-containing protein n=1 Tax=uncultured Desulfosarcina sp. TaxID=218289 RepID=UPI0029C820BA|nr:Mut7-C RNAse domain-containing protein [uncultured Desulfosarcina sp.]